MLGVGGVRPKLDRQNLPIEWFLACSSGLGMSTDSHKQEKTVFILNFYPSPNGGNLISEPRLPAPAATASILIAGDYSPVLTGGHRLRPLPRVPDHPESDLLTIINLGHSLRPSTKLVHSHGAGWSSKSSHDLAGCSNSFGGRFGADLEEGW